MHIVGILWLFTLQNAAAQFSSFSFTVYLSIALFVSCYPHSLFISLCLSLFLSLSLSLALFLFPFLFLAFPPLTVGRSRAKIRCTNYKCNNFECAAFCSASREWQVGLRFVSWMNKTNATVIAASAAALEWMDLNVNIDIDFVVFQNETFGMATWKKLYLSLLSGTLDFSFANDMVFSSMYRWIII